jgi:hypothetical protein
VACSEAAAPQTCEGKKKQEDRHASIVVTRLAVAHSENASTFPLTWLPRRDLLFGDRWSGPSGRRGWLSRRCDTSTDQATRVPRSSHSRPARSRSDAGDECCGFLLPTFVDSP